MCCSLGPASFSRTQLYAGEAERDGRVVHVLAYRNSASNRMRRRGALMSALFGPSPGNAMLLHFPARAPMGPANVLDTRGSEGLFGAMHAAAFPPEPSAAGDDEISAMSAPRAAAQVFSVGDYTVVLADDARAIPDALSRVPQAQRPDPNPRIFDWYAKHFPGWPVALCCFKADLRDPAPLLWWYEPKNPDELFMPALDAHDGGSPRTNEDVEVNHTVFLGSHRSSAGAQVDYGGHEVTDPSVLALLAPLVVGRYFDGELANGDFFAPLDAVRAGEVRIERRAPR